MSFNVWKVLKLGDICDISSSKRIYAKEYQSSGIPFYRGKEIIEKFKGNDISTELFIKEERFNELKYKFGAPAIGDILLSSVGTLGVPYLVQDEKFYFKDGNLTWFKNFVNSQSEFIFLWLQSQYAKNQINSRAIGSTQKALTIDVLKKFDINLPPIQEQKAIAATLSCLDEKIELNNRINKALEEMAQAIFKSWFVDFEPFQDGEFEDSELGKIPKGWRVVELSSIVSVNKRGFSPKYTKNNEGIPVINQRCIRNHTVIEEAVQYHDNSVRTAPKDLFHKPFDILINSMGVGTLGRVAQVAIVNDIKIVHSCITILRANEKLIFPIILGYFIKNLEDKIEDMGTGTTGQTSLNNKFLGSLNLALPPLVIQREVSDILTNLLIYINKNNLENNHLIQIRDSLLPKLMSGEIRVPVEEVLADG